ncbi:hypothetical protein BHU25_01775 [Pseudomonas vranovensis]|uniref:Uncharacterized protein n=1 Tax=Pseudomonas vranovensis TaxID=321661 RepID=A0A423DZJ1_9PSED|nr:hypothetical protein BHU25_01775 [Pseudomonas vranovensis]
MLGQRHHFGNHQRIAGNDHLVAGLGYLPCPDRPHVGHALTKGQQQRAHALKVGRLTTGHDRQSAGFGAWRAAGDRGVEPVHAGFRRQFAGHLTGSGRLEAGKIHQQLAGLACASNALLTKHHLAHHRRVGQAQHQHIGVLAQLGRGSHLAGTGLDQFGAFVRRAIPHRQRITRGQQPPTHGQAHQPDTGKPQRRTCSAHVQLQTD